jgi:small-conductance mechanosensitive channel
MRVLHDPQVQFVAALLVANALAVYLFRRVLKRLAGRLHHHSRTSEHHLLGDLVRCALGPVSFLAWYYALFAIAETLVRSDWYHGDAAFAALVLRRCGTLGVVVACLWFFQAATRVLDAVLRRTAARTEGRLDDVVLPLLGTALRVMVPIVGIFLLIRLFPLSDTGMSVTRKLLAFALIAAITWTARRAVLLIDQAVLGAGGVAGTATLAQRALFTRVRMLRRVALVLIGLFAVSSVLMMFDEVRDLGRSILASAGIAGIVLGIAAQRSLGNLLAGIQIAVTQPIRLGDQVLVEGDVGNIEEITLTYVVVRVWDERRIVLPISYFIEKPFQNWSRVPSNMLAPLTLRFDYSLPVDELRAFVEAEIAKSQFWDRKTLSVQITAADDRSMEVRVLASAPDSGAAFNLQCELREKTIRWVQQTHPAALPHVRSVQRRLEASDETRVDHPAHPLAQVARPPVT